MRCLSCQSEMTSTEAQRFGRLLLCPGCAALAVKAEREISHTIAQAKFHALQWLEQHIMRGGLLAGGSGDGTRDATRHALALSKVREVRGEEKAEGPAVPVAAEQRSPHPGVRK